MATSSPTRYDEAWVWRQGIVVTGGGVKMLRIAATLAIVVMLASWSFADEGKVPLKTDFPEEILAGTPPDVLARLFPGLERPTGKRAPFMVPKGTTNLALKTKITSSETRPLIGKLAFVCDGSKKGTEDAYVELSPGVQWVQIDLEKSSKIHAVYLWHFFREARSYRDVVVQVADDEKFTKNVRTIYNNDVDNSSKMGIGRDRPYMETNFGKLIKTEGITARYVRLYSKGNTANNLNHYVEVEVFGEPAS